MRPLKTETNELTDQPIEELEAALAWHNGDARATIRTLLADCSHLRAQLAIARGAMSVGFTRGWSPKLDRENS